MMIFKLAGEEPEMMSTTLGVGVAYGVFYAALFGLALVAIIWSLSSTKIDQTNPGEEVISARNTSKWWGIAASFFSSAMGSWVLESPSEVGAVAGWWGVIGYALATAVPWTFLAIFGPRMRSLTAGNGFTSVDFIKIRLGLALHIVYFLFTLGTVFIAFVVEATTISRIFTTISPNTLAVVITVSIAVVTFSYTFLAGLRATMLTDRLQFFVLLILMAVGAWAVYGEALKQIPRAEIREVGKFTWNGLLCAAILNVSCFFPTFMDPSSWSRMYTARSERDARVGLLAAAGLLLVPMIFFGSIGIISQAAINAGTITPADSSFSPLFALLTIIRPGFSVVLLLLATCLSASTIDTFSSGFASVVAAEIGLRNMNYNWARFLATLVFVAALVTAMFNPPSVMTLFMVSNLGSACATPPLLLSLWPHVTAFGCAAGIIGGALSIFTFGWIRMGTAAGGAEWWLLPEGFYLAHALYTFLAAGGISTALTLLVSQVHFFWRKDARDEQRAKFLRLKVALAGLHEPIVEKDISMMSSFAGSEPTHVILP